MVRKMRQILKYPFCYNLYQNIVGCRGFLKNYVRKFIEPKLKTADASILDFGCGTANIAEFIPLNVSYTGIDASLKYINYDSKKYPNHKFICKYAHEDLNLNKKFNIIMSEALLSALSDEDAQKMFSTMKAHANKDSKFVFSDMNYSLSNSKIEKFLLCHERGHHLRTKEQFADLISKHFKIDNITVLKNVYRIPYSKVVFECSLPM